LSEQVEETIASLKSVHLPTLDNVVVLSGRFCSRQGDGMSITLFVGLVSVFCQIIPVVYHLHFITFSIIYLVSVN